MPLLNSWADIKQLPDSKRQRAINTDILLLRSYATWSAGLLSLAGVRSWPVFETVMGCGVLIDVLRHIFAPELRLRPSELCRLVEQREYPRQGVDRRIFYVNTFLVVLYALWVAFAFALATHIDTNEATRAPDFLDWITPLQPFAAMLSSIARRFPSELIAHGYINRATLVGDVFTLGFLVFVLMLLLPLTGIGFLVVTPSICRMMKFPETLPNHTRKFGRKVAIAAALGWGNYFGIEWFTSIDWAMKLRTGWHLDFTNEPLFMYVVCISFIWFMTYTFYPFVVAYRTWAIWICEHGPIAMRG